MGHVQNGGPEITREPVMRKNAFLAAAAVLMVFGPQLATAAPRSTVQLSTDVQLAQYYGGYRYGNRRAYRPHYRFRYYGGYGGYD